MKRFAGFMIAVAAAVFPVLGNAYSLSDADIVAVDFNSGSVGAFANRLEPPTVPLGFGNWVIRQGETAMWSNAIFASRTPSGPGFTKGVTNHPLAEGGALPPKDLSVAFRLQAQLPQSLDFYLFFVTLRSDPMNGTGWQFIVDHEGRLQVRRFLGRGQFQPAFNENDPLSDLNEPALGSTGAGVVDVNNPANQYIRLWIEGDFGDVKLRAKAWKGTPEDEPAAFVIDVVDSLPEPPPIQGPFGPVAFSGNSGMDIIVDYEPPVTTDAAATNTVGTLIDDFAAFKLNAQSNTEHWSLYQ